MTAATWDTVCAALDAALALPDADRDAYLDALPDADVAREARRFLDHADRRDPVVDAFGAEGPSLVEQILLLADPDVDWPAPGAFVGPYRLEARVGEGGHGAVYRAHDPDADRTVAVKMLASRREGIYTRLRREVRVLARLDHPFVARFYAAGQTDDGRAYFAMEWVDGQPITAFADAHRLGFDARLALLRQVAEAVQHAHERLVLHRDLKPDNVLVVDAPGGPQAKVVDFGIGKITDDLGEEAPQALVPYLRLTPAYAAPEQLRGEPATVASDLYSLAVLGRELLFAHDPPPTECSRDVEAALAHALAPDPQERYPTVSAFLADLGCAAEGRPVSVRALPRRERTRRFVRRNRSRVLLFGGIALAFVLATALYVASVAQARARAEREAAAASEAMAMLTGVFRSADPFSERTDTLRARQIVAAAAAAFEKNPPKDPYVRGRVGCTLGGLYVEMQENEAARRLLDACLAAPPSPLPDWYVTGLYNRAELVYVTRSAAEATATAADALALVKAKGDTSAVPFGQLLAAAGGYRLAAGEVEPAVRLLARAVQAMERGGARPEELAQVLNVQAESFMAQGAYPQAQRVARRALDTLSAVYGARSPRTGSARSTLANIYSESGRLGAADSVLVDLVKDYRASLGPRHQLTLRTASDLATARARNGNLDSALVLYEALLPQFREVFGEDNAFTLLVCSSLGRVYSEQGRASEGYRLLAPCLAKAQQHLGPAHATTLQLQGNTARALLSLNRPAEAETLLRASTGGMRTALGSHPMVYMSEGMLAQALAAQGKRAEALVHADSARAGLLRVLGPDHPAAQSAGELVARLRGK